jgi:hypothetical protein
VLDVKPESRDMEFHLLDEASVWHGNIALGGFRNGDGCQIRLRGLPAACMNDELGHDNTSRK